MLKKLRKLFVSSILMSIGMGLMDIENPPEPPTQQQVDDWVRSMNKFMPLKDEVVLIGIKGAFKKIAIIENVGRRLDTVRSLVSPLFEDPEFRELDRHVHQLADTSPFSQLIAVDIFANVEPTRPILPDHRKIVILSVSKEDGEVELIDIREGSFTRAKPEVANFVKVATYYKGFDYFACGRVLLHGWPD